MERERSECTSTERNYRCCHTIRYGMLRYGTARHVMHGVSSSEGGRDYRPEEQQKERNGRKVAEICRELRGRRRTEGGPKNKRRQWIYAMAASYYSDPVNQGT